MLYTATMVRALLERRKTVTRRLVNLDRLRVRARHRVTADWPSIIDPAGDLLCEAGKVYPAHIAEMGAVSAVMPNGKHLGLKPGEFDFVCPYADGETVLEHGGPRWAVRPRDSFLYVRETWRALHRFESRRPSEVPAGSYVWYEADGGEDLQGRPGRLDRFGRVRPSIFMPKWASRIRLRVLAVNLERLQEITVEDAEAEGLTKLSKDGRQTWKYGIPDRDGEPGEDDDGWHWYRWRMSPVDAFEALWDSINAGRGHPWSSNPWVWRIAFAIDRVGTS